MNGARFRLGLATALCLLIVIAITVIGCASVSETKLDACLAEDSSYADQITENDESWSGAMKDVAESTDSVPSFVSAENKLMTLKKTAQQLTPPGCAESDHERYVEGMSSIIAMYQELMPSPDGDPDPASLSNAEQNMASLQQSFGAE